MVCEEFEVDESDFFCIEDYYNRRAHCYQGRKFEKGQTFPFSFFPLKTENFIHIKFRSDEEVVGNGFR